MKKIVSSVIFVFSIFFSNAQAPTFQWAKNFGGWLKIAINQGKSIAVDTIGNVYTTGYFKGTYDFDPGSGVFNISSVGGLNDIFISKLDASGNFLWAKSIGSTADDISTSIALDANGNPYITGYFYGTADFDPGFGVFNLTCTGGAENAFILKLDSFGNFLWANSIAGSDSKGYSITSDFLGSIYVTGYFMNLTDFDTSIGIYNLTDSGNGDVFVLKIDTSGNFIWAKNMGGLGPDNGRCIAVDVSGNVYTTGVFWDISDFDPSSGIYNLTSLGFTDVFISKLDSSGNFIWAKSFGDTLNEDGLSIAVDAIGNVYTTGCFQDTVDFDPSSSVQYLASFSPSTYDIFISKLDSLGNFVWAKNIGGVSHDVGQSIALDTMGNVYTTGIFQGTVDFDPSPSTLNFTSVGGDDIFISKLSSSGNLIWTKTMGGVLSDDASSLTLDELGNIYTTGTFDGTVDFDPGSGVYNVTAIGYDLFVHKMSQGNSSNEVQENLNEIDITVYPNPSNNYIDIETSLNDYFLSVFDIMGKLIKKERIDKTRTTIDISSFSNGIYFIQLANGDKIISKKFIKE